MGELSTYNLVCNSWHYYLLLLNSYSSSCSTTDNSLGDHYCHSLSFLFFGPILLMHYKMFILWFSYWVCSPTCFIEKWALPKACLYMKNCFHKIWNNYQLCRLKFTEITIYHYSNWTLDSCTLCFYTKFIYSSETLKVQFLFKVIGLHENDENLFDVSLIYLSFLIKNYWPGYILVAYKFI